MTAVALLRRYPVVGLAVAVAAVGGALELLGLSVVATWGISLFSLSIAARSGWRMVRSLLRGHVGLDVLAVTAIIATVLVGEYWASIVIVVMLSGGETLEDFAEGRAERELTSLLERVPQIAHRYRADGSFEDVPATDVRIGDRLLVRPSELVPVDARLVSASGTFDESSLTGESLPVDKVDGDSVLSGSVNGFDAVDVVATAVAADSHYQRIVELVSAAKESKAPLVRLADRYAVPFTIVSYVIAGVAWWLGGDPQRFAEVLVVATPCPLLIGAPVAFMAGMSSAARSGIVVKNAGTLEKLARAKTVAFDKTGTLTHGTPRVVAVHPVDGEPDDLLVLVGSAEQYSSHVLAGALRDAVAERGLPLKEAVGASQVATHGVQATIDGHTVFVGKPKYVASIATDVPPLTLGPGEAAVYVAIDGRYAGSIVLRDDIRSDASATLEVLRQHRVTHIMMLTGDIEPVARHVGAQLGIDDVRAECLPEDKVVAVRDASPRPVVMV